MQVKKRLIAGLSPAGTATTLVNLVMGGLPEVFAMGDTYSIKNYTGATDRPGGITLHGAFCGECSNDKLCPIFTPELLQLCKETPQGTYQEIGKKTTKPVLYTQDSPGAKYDEKGLPDFVLLLYRDIKPWCAAWALWLVGGRRFTKEIDSALPVRGTDHYEAAIARWCSFYREAFAWLKARKVPWGALNTDELRKSPEAVLRRVCHVLGLEFDSRALRWWTNKHHKLGGRYNASRGKQSRLGHAIVFDQAWKGYATVEQAEHIHYQRARWEPHWHRLETRKIATSDSK